MSEARRAAQGWKTRAEKVREYKPAEEGLASQEPSFGYQGVSPWQWERAMRLRDGLMRKFGGKRLEEVIPGKVVSNRYGSCYQISARRRAGFRTPKLQAAKAGIFSNLKLIFGIGEVTESQLKGEGWLTLAELTEHARWGDEARLLVELVNRRDTKGLQQRVWHWFPKSHPLSFFLAGLHQEEEFALVDIETLGLFGRAIILLGAASPQSDGLEVNQWLVRGLKDERAALHQFWSTIAKGKAVISYNGRAFDIPAVEERLGYYGEIVEFTGPHFDLLHFSRRAWGAQLPDCRLDTLESQLLKLRRADDVPSALVPQFYQTYLESENVGPLAAIVAHNRQDLVSLASIFSKLCHEWEDASS